jgi:hypothetical protein
MFFSPFRSPAPVGAGDAAIFPQLTVFTCCDKSLPALRANTCAGRVLPVGYVGVSVIPCRAAFVRAELFPAASGILRKQTAAIRADVHVLIFSDDLFKQGICPPSVFVLRRNATATFPKSRNIPEIR